jgi:hypothetical protein
MTLPDVSLQQLLLGMRGWFGMIERGANVSVRAEPVPMNGFFLIARWRNGQEYRKHYTPGYVFGHPRKKPCDHARDFLRELLQQRGI